MSSPAQSVTRTPIHQRTITGQVYERSDGLWDLEATLLDVKDYDFSYKDGEIHPAGQPVHHMQVCITVDDQFSIVDAHVNYEAAPYGDSCTRISDAYRGLIGLNLVRGFRHAVRDRFGRTAGCTHMTELCQVLPTLAIQGMSPRLAKKRPPEEQGKRKPLAVDGCHALRSDGPVVKEFYPKWYQAPKKEV